MLPAAARLKRREDFALVVRHGRRAGRGTLVAHYLAPDPPDAAGPARAGFVVGRAVGGSVDRHRVVRRLRHLVRDRLDRLPAGSRLVVRALPPARDADSAALGGDLDAALARLGLAERAATAERAVGHEPAPAGSAVTVGPAATAGRAASREPVPAGSAVTVDPAVTAERAVGHEPAPAGSAVTAGPAATAGRAATVDPAATGVAQDPVGEVSR